MSISPLVSSVWSPGKTVCVPLHPSQRGIVEYDDTETDNMEEGCLSLPAIHEKVVRPTRIRVTWMDEQFQPHDEWVDGYLARVMQHEFDHLEGKMFVDRISPLRKQLVKSKLRALMQGRYRCGYKTKPVRK